MHSIEPFYGWLELYSHETDANSPFHSVEHNLFHFDRAIYNYCAHPLWDEIGSESLLVKILYADYERSFAVIELIGEWNDLFENDFKLLAENCLTYLVDQGIQKFIFIGENVFNIYLEEDDYYEAMQEELEDGWMCMIRAREGVLSELNQYGIDQYIFSSGRLDQLNWRKLKPWDLFKQVSACIDTLLLS